MVICLSVVDLSCLVDLTAYYRRFISVAFDVEATACFTEIRWVIWQVFLLLNNLMQVHIIQNIIVSVAAMNDERQQ